MSIIKRFEATPTQFQKSAMSGSPIARSVPRPVCR